MKMRWLSWQALALIFCLLCAGPTQAHSCKFALVTDTHVGSTWGAEDLQKTVADINSRADLEFVLLAGDITEFGADAELLEAREILSRLEKPWYIVPGNHDSKWSESGCNSFAQIFGGETFSCLHKGLLFIGTASGPNMRMAPGLVPREQLLELEELLSGAGEQPIIFVNHYPLNEELANSGALLRLLKRRNIQACLLGHGHANKLLDFAGVPGIMGRANVRSDRGPGGYTMVTADSAQLVFAEQRHDQETSPPWLCLPLRPGGGEDNRLMDDQPSPEPAPPSPQTKVKSLWRFTASSDIGSGVTVAGKRALFATTQGEIMALDIRSGAVRWRFATHGKVYGTPAASSGRVVCASTDSSVYCLDLRHGRQIWRRATGKSIVASPLIRERRVYLGSSEGLFRCLDLADGRLIWQFDGVRNFVECLPLFYDGKIFFGSWGNAFYALDARRGGLLWKREKYVNRMLSPAAVHPVAAHGKIFFVAPDRHMTALDAASGGEIWDSDLFSCRESIGLAANGELVYIKTMKEGDLCAFQTRTERQELAWRCVTGAGYEIGPTPLLEHDGLVLMPTTAGTIYAVDKKEQRVVWTFKLADALITGLALAGKNRIVAVSLDGAAACLEWNLP